MQTLMLCTRTIISWYVIQFAIEDIINYRYRVCRIKLVVILNINLVQFATEMSLYYCMYIHFTYERMN